MTPEGKVKWALRRALKEAGAYQFWAVQTGRGAPCLDCHGCYKGIYFAVEAKAPGKLPTPRQEGTIMQIYRAGGYVTVIDSVEEAKSFPAQLEEEWKNGTRGVRRHFGERS